MRSLTPRQAMYGAVIAIIILTVVTLVSSGSGGVLLLAAQKFVGAVGLWAPIIFTFLCIFTRTFLEVKVDSSWNEGSFVSSICRIYFKTN